MTINNDAYAPAQETTEGRVYSVTGGDWDSLVTEIGQAKEERVVVNMGPQHPSTHGVLRLLKHVPVLVIFTPVLKRTRNIALGPKELLL